MRSPQTSMSPGPKMGILWSARDGKDLCRVTNFVADTEPRDKREWKTSAIGAIILSGVLSLSVGNNYSWAKRAPWTMETTRVTLKLWTKRSRDHLRWVVNGVTCPIVSFKSSQTFQVKVIYAVSTKPLLDSSSLGNHEILLGSNFSLDCKVLNEDSKAGLRIQYFKTNLTKEGNLEPSQISTPAKSFFKVNFRMSTGTR